MLRSFALCVVLLLAQGTAFSQDPTPEQRFALRRDAARARMAPHSVAVFRSAPSAPRTASSDYLFRQSNNLYYLTGCTDESVTLVLFADSLLLGGHSTHEMLFVPRRNPAKELWNGVRNGPAEAAAMFGIAAMPSDSLDSVLTHVLPTATALYYDWIHDVVAEALPLDVKFIGREQEKALKEKFPSITHVRGTANLTDTLRLIKSPDELALMQRAIDLSCAGHRAAMKAAHEGMREFELAAEFDHTVESGGAEGLAYPDIVGSGPNACTLHYEANRRQIQPHELVLMDCGGEYGGYAADITRTFPIDGKFSTEQRAIYELVLKAQAAGIDEVRPGAPFTAPHKKALAVISEGLIALGIIASDSSVKKYFPHGTSHTLGLDVHDTRAGMTLEPNMVITVEPGIYIPANSACDKKWWNIGVRIEDDVLVTFDGHRVLSDCAPKSVAELEKMVGR